MTKNGFTLVELLVVLTIIAIISIISFANFKNFSKEQVLNKTTNEIQSFIKLSQANSTTNLQCQGNSPISWQNKFSKMGAVYKLETICQFFASSDPSLAGCSFDAATKVVTCVIKSYELGPKLFIDKIYLGPATADDGLCTSTDLSVTTVTIYFSPLYGKVDFSFTSPTCLSRDTLNILLGSQDISTDCSDRKNCKNIIVGRGGSISIP